ncbi:hypothetical protein HOY82DRAFT_489764 [Tuber indicum]|nr:hypothetical protein HOY82DRAFT_489764 [Tuber indicum]
MDTHEQMISLTLNAIENDISERKPDNEYGISQTILHSHHSGRSSSHVGHQHQQCLSVEQETTLCIRILDQEACGYAPSHSQMRVTLGFMLSMSGDTAPLGKK